MSQPWENDPISKPAPQAPQAAKSEPWANDPISTASAKGNPWDNDPIKDSGPGVAHRILNAANTGLSGLLAAPGDIAKAVLGKVGIDIPDPTAAADSIAGNSRDASFAPQSRTEQYAQSTASAIGGNAVPLMGTLGAGLRVAEASLNPIAQAARSAAQAGLPAAVAGDVVASAGQGSGGQIARDVFPNSPVADAIGQLAGGLSAGALTHAITALFKGGASAETLIAAGGNPEEVRAAVAQRDKTGDTSVDVRPAEVPQEAVQQANATAPAIAPEAVSAAPAQPQGISAADLPTAQPIEGSPPELANLPSGTKGEQFPEMTPGQAEGAVAEGVRQVDTPPGQSPNPPINSKGPLLGNTVPEEALRDGPYPQTKYANNVNTETYQLSPEENQYVHEAVQDLKPGTRSHDEVADDVVGLLKTKPTLDILAHDPKLSEADKYQAAVQVIGKVATKRMSEAADRIQDPTQDSTVANEDFNRERYTAALAFAKDSNNSTLVGRLLNARKIKPGDNDAGMAQAFSKMGEEFGHLDAQKFAELVQKYKNNPKALGKLAADSYTPHWEDYAMSAWYNSLLSGPLTHLRNIAGNAMNFAWDIGEHSVAAGLGKLRGGNDRVSMEEVNARIGGVIDALKDSKTWSNSAEAYRRGQSLTMQGENLHAAVSDLLPKGKLRTAAKVAEYGTRGLAAEDEFFRNLFMSSAYQGEARRIALSEGLTGDHYRQRVQQLLAAPSKSMNRLVEDYSRRIQFIDDPSPIGKVVQALKANKVNGTAVDRLSKVVTNIVIPFARVTDSTMRTILRRSPLGFLDRYNRADFIAGGARRDLAIARVALGSTALGAVATAAYKGLFTGDGPDDFRKRAEMQAGGWMPNSVKIGDSYHSLSGLSPASNQINVIAGLVEKYKSGEMAEAPFGDKMIKMTQQFLKLMNNNNFTGDLGNILSAISDGGRGDGAWKNYVSSLATSVTTPAVIRQGVQTFGDQLARNTTGDGSIVDSITGRTEQTYSPSSLPVKHDVYGNEITQPTDAGLVKTSTTDRGAVIKELQRLAPADKTLVTPAPKTITLDDGTKVKLNAEQYERYQNISGKYIQQGVAQAMAHPRWPTASDDDKREAVKDIMKDARDAAKEQLFQ